MTRVEELRQLIDKSVLDADKAISKINIEKITKYLHGFCSIRIKHLLNNLCSEENTVYLEYGSFRGATLISALFKNSTTKAYAVENFTYNPYETETYNEKGWGNVIKGFNDNVKSFGLTEQVNLLNTNGRIEKLKSIQEPVNVLFFDIKDDAYPYLCNAIPKLNKTAIIITSLYREDKVVEGIEKALDHKKVTVHYDVVLTSGAREDTRTWWSGVKIWLVEKDVEKDRAALVEAANKATKEKTE